jgi:hypothetical protein
MAMRPQKMTMKFGSIVDPTTEHDDTDESLPQYDEEQLGREHLRAKAPDSGREIESNA